MIDLMRWPWFVIVASACGRIDFDARAGDGGADGPPPCTGFGPWSSRVHVDSVGSTGEDRAPALSADKLVLVFDTDKDGTRDLYVATRATTVDAFGTPVPIANSTELAEAGPAWFGHDLYFSTFNVTTFDFNTMITTYRGQTTFDPPHAIDTLPGDHIEIANGALELFYTENPSADFYQLQHGTRAAADMPWSFDDSLAPLNAGYSDGWPSFDDARQTLYFERAMGNGPAEIATATRADYASPFGTATPLTELGTNVGDPDISADGTMLLFAGVFAEGKGADDIYYVTRACQ